MNKKKILTIVGARPQFIKAAALSKALSQNKEFEEIIIHTGQHFDKNMSAVFFDEMSIPEPKYQFDINSLGHGAMTGRMLESIETVLIKEKPEIVIVYGDTNSTLAGAIAAKKLHIKLAHIEAGLRSYNMLMPEEINRILTDRISDYLFCPTENAVQNLKNEGYDNFKVKMVNCGDIMFDSMKLFSDYPLKNENFKIFVQEEAYILCTIHRAENTDDPDRLIAIVEALNLISKNTRIILPLHPRTRNILKNHDLNKNIFIIEPVGYFEMLYLLKECKIVMTDSGGLQKEAYFNKKYCITLRDETEWIELIESGCNKLAGADKSKIIEIYNDYIDKKFKDQGMYYGEGNTSLKIINTLLEN